MGEQQRDGASDLIETATMLSQLPILVRFVVQLGVPAAIACALVWFLMGQVTTGLKALSDQGAANANMMQQHVAHDAVLDKKLDDWLKVSRRICVNTAKTDIEIDGCLER